MVSELQNPERYILPLVLPVPALTCSHDALLIVQVDTDRGACSECHPSLSHLTCVHLEAEELLESVGPPMDFAQPVGLSVIRQTPSPFVRANADGPLDHLDLGCPAQAGTAGEDPE